MKRSVFQVPFSYLNEDNIACGFLLASLLDNTPLNNIRHLKSGAGISQKSQIDKYLGIQVLWVYKPFRRMKIGSQLLDTAKTSFLDNFVFENDILCFSDTTEDGNNFAKKYVGQDDYLIYKFRS